MSRFFEELKRRHVIKSTIAYLVVSWIIIQVALAVLPTFGAPDWINQAIIIALAVGLPIWIIVSWVYDITPQGIEKTEVPTYTSEKEQSANKQLNAFLIASLSIAVLVLGVKVSGVLESENEGELSIAVLPFVNMSDDREQEYFSDGISEEIINMLAQVPELKVISRTSSFAFKGKNEDVKLIAEKLNVSHVLEGSVRRSGNTLRVTAQLIDCADGSHLYSDKYDRKIEDIFNIQDEISEEILSAVKVNLIGEEKEAVFKKYTDNLEAYDEFLKGKFHENKFTPEGFFKAIEYYNKAIAIDSNYAPAYVGKSFSYANLLDFNFGATEDMLPLARGAADIALQIDDNFADSHLAVGRIQLHQDWNVDKALKSFNKALELNPNNAQAYNQINFCRIYRDECDNIMTYAQKAESLDPLSVLNLWYIALSPVNCGQGETPLFYGEKILELDPNAFSGYMIKGMGLLNLEQYDKAIKAFQQMANLYPGTLTLSILASAYGIMGDEVKAREIISQIKTIEGFDRFSNNSVVKPYVTIGDFDNAFFYANKALDNREANLKWDLEGIEDALDTEFVKYSKFRDDPRYPELINRINKVYNIDWF